MKKLGLSLIGLLISTTVWANNTTIEADTVSVKTHRIKIAQIIGPNAPVFLELKNRGQNPVVLVSVISPIAKQTELRKINKMVGDVISTHPASTISFKPMNQKNNPKSEEFSVMLIGLKKNPEKLGMLPLTLVFEDGSYLRINAKIDHRKS